VLYLDSSAIVKLVVLEPGSSALVDVVSSDPDVVSSAVAYTEVMRAVRRAGGPTRRAEQVLRSIALVPIDRAILREAATIAPTSLRSLDALHLASALSLRPDVDALVSYDARLSRAATAAGLVVAGAS
jgi:predicted nucleic acid-binding protein